MATKSYYEKLKDPKWQKRRLCILEKNNFACQFCLSSDLELHIHHVYYLPKRNPWDYPDDALRCLCKSCHEEMQQKTTALMELISITPDSNVPWDLFREFFSIYNNKSTNQHWWNSLTSILINMVSPAGCDTEKKILLSNITIQYLEICKRIVNAE